MTDKLKRLLSETSQLLIACGWESKAEWFDGVREELRFAEDEPEKTSEVLKTLDRALSGMGSFNDLPLTPPDGEMTQQEARSKQWRLASELAEAVEELMRQGSSRP